MKNYMVLLALELLAGSRINSDVESIYQADDRAVRISSEESSSVKPSKVDKPRALQRALSLRPSLAAISGKAVGMKTLGGALSDAKYKKVHSFGRRGKERGRGPGTSVKERRTRGLSRNLAPQASVVKGREVLQIGSTFGVYIVFPLKEPQKRP
ncbi:hypothetical protein KM043_004609 [Ampulex compressa]|nr:hypothetical protein KM043_004609 [Ampulex compressa]